MIANPLYNPEKAQIKETKQWVYQNIVQSLTKLRDSIREDCPELFMPLDRALKEIDGLINAKTVANADSHLKYAQMIADSSENQQIALLRFQLKECLDSDYKIDEDKSFGWQPKFDNS